MIIITEKEMKGYNMDLESAYNIFKTSYEASVGKSWTYDKFVSRAKDWTFYGDEEGYVAVRIQRSGMYKLVGSAGNYRSMYKGFKELDSKNVPIWGMATKEIKDMLVKLNFISPKAFVIKTLIKFIPKEVFGGVEVKVNSDGSVTFNYEDVGVIKKYFIGNKLYFKFLLEKSGLPIPEIIKKFIISIIK